MHFLKIKVFFVFFWRAAMWNIVVRGGNISVTSPVYHLTTFSLVLFLFSSSDPRCCFSTVSSQMFFFIQLHRSCSTWYLTPISPLRHSFFSKKQSLAGYWVKAMKSSPAVNVAGAEEAVRMLADEQGGTSMFLMLNPVFVAVLGHDFVKGTKLGFPMIMYRFCFLALLPLRLHPKVWHVLWLSTEQS